MVRHLYIDVRSAACLWEHVHRKYLFKETYPRPNFIARLLMLEAAGKSGRFAHRLNLRDRGLNSRGFPNDRIACRQRARFFQTPLIS